MSFNTIERRTCDHCKIVMDHPFPGWQQVRGGQERQDFCGWECLAKYALARIPVRDVCVRGDDNAR